ncbi:hypothetical protein EDM57_10055 [Brevibacillus gelatini]|uniref:Uncharacterized protein n=1 Tax=Brevibacillus gelatini TaxID=1655277 RepID=A0A3M8B2K2_9BACL|nr:hypothetical protein EDM57_10055 [Brevibacillus gelatini]
MLDNVLYARLPFAVPVHTRKTRLPWNRKKADLIVIILFFVVPFLFVIFFVVFFAVFLLVLIPVFFITRIFAVFIVRFLFQSDRKGRWLILCHDRLWRNGGLRSWRSGVLDRRLGRLLLLGFRRRLGRFFLRLRFHGLLLHFLFIRWRWISAWSRSFRSVHHFLFLHDRGRSNVRTLAERIWLQRLMLSGAACEQHADQQAGCNCRTANSGEPHFHSLPFFRFRQRRRLALNFQSRQGFLNSCRRF